MRRLQVALILVLGVALLAAIWIDIHQSRQLQEVQQQRDEYLHSLRQTREALRQAELRSAAAAAKSQKSTNQDRAAIVQRDATIKQLNSKVSAGQARITRLQKELVATKEKNAKNLASANERYRELQADLQAQIGDLQKKLDSARADIRNSQHHIAELQKVNAKLKAENTKGSRRIAEQEHILARLQNLNRRREAYLSSIADRYREVTNRFRTMSGILDSDRNQNSSTFSGAALDLIQNTLSLAQDDLQHLSDLNAEAFRLEKKLAKK